MHTRCPLRQGLAFCPDSQYYVHGGCLIVLFDANMCRQITEPSIPSPGDGSFPSDTGTKIACTVGATDPDAQSAQAVQRLINASGLPKNQVWHEGPMQQGVVVPCRVSGVAFGCRAGASRSDCRTRPACWESWSVKQRFEMHQTLHPEDVCPVQQLCCIQHSYAAFLERAEEPVRLFPPGLSAPVR